MKPGLIALLLLSINSYCQSNKYVHPSTLGIHFILDDFKSKGAFGMVSNMDAGLSLGYIKGLGSHFDLGINVTGSFPDSVSKKLSFNEKSLLLQGDASLRTRLLSKQNWINPFLLTGLGAGTYRSNFVPYALIGPGIEFNYKDVYFTTSAQYRASFSNKLMHHYFYSIGICGLIGKKEKKKVAVVIPNTQRVNVVKDSDGDGIIDSLDACPTTPGLAKYHGCPFPDRDKDGIADEEDKCPDIPGILKYQGCPIPDTDGDGINDQQDSCITVVGVRENHGCPLIKKEIKDEVDLAAKNIFFKTGSYELLPKSFPALDLVTKILKDNPSILISIEGHTDNVGTRQSNQILSENRANAVMQYITSKGIDSSRLKATGFGQIRPVDTNNTSGGRANNRRVEMKLSY